MMYKTIFRLIIISVLLISAFAANAFVRYEDKHPQKRRDIYVTGFIDYAPFGFVATPKGKIFGKYTSIFQPMMDTLAKENNLRIFYDFPKKSYHPLVAEVRKGEVDMILGAYNQTELYRGLEFIFPAGIYNPISIFMLPNRVNEINSLDHAKKLKGVRLKDEVYSDFVSEQLKAYNLTVVDTPYELFEALFTRKADYIMIGYYYGLIEAIKLGLKEQIAVSKQVVWRIPMFIGVSKVSKNRDLLSQKLTLYLEKPENQKLLLDNIEQQIKEFEEKSEGIVPPTFGLEKSNN